MKLRDQLAAQIANKAAEILQPEPSGDDAGDGGSEDVSEEDGDDEEVTPDMGVASTTDSDASATGPTEPITPTMSATVAYNPSEPIPVVPISRGEV